VDLPRIIKTLWSTIQKMSSYEDLRNDKDNEHALKPSTLENIDTAMFLWLEEELNVHTRTNTGWKPVPVIWSGEERSYQIKKDRDIRDNNGSLIFPLITIRRANKNKSMSSKGSFWANTRPVDDINGGVVAFKRKTNQKKTNNFERAETIQKTNGTKINFKTKKKNENPVTKTLYIPLPIYLDIEYEITLRADFQQQMNNMVTPFINYSKGINHFMVENNGWSYECFFDEDFSEDNNSSNFHEEERSFKTKIGINTLGYLIGDGDNEKGSEITVKESAVKVSYEEKIVTGSFRGR